MMSDELSQRVRASSCGGILANICQNLVESLEKANARIERLALLEQRITALEQREVDWIYLRSELDYPPELLEVWVLTRTRKVMKDTFYRDGYTSKALWHHAKKFTDVVAWKPIREVEEQDGCDNL